MTKECRTLSNWDRDLTALLQSDEDACRALNTIRTQLNTLITLKPLPNKLLSIPQVFISSQLSEDNTELLKEVRFVNLILAGERY